MALYQLIYQSLALIPFETPDLTALLHRCCSYNQRHDITGLLLYTQDGRFLQVLEGEEHEVRRLHFNSIAMDPRHHSCRILSEGPCAQRSFAGWAMGFRLATPRDFRTLLSSVPPDSRGLLVPRPRTRPELMLLLHQFIESGEVEATIEHPWHESEELKWH